MAKEKVITLENYRDCFVKVFPTETNVTHPKGVAVMMHPTAANILIKKGVMTEEEPEGYIEPEDND